MQAQRLAHDIEPARQRRVAREAEGVWRISGDRGELTLRLAPEGVPELEGDSGVWPLED